MKTVYLMVLVSLLPILFCSCESVKEDAKDTPIGSVISGKTRDTETYIERVRKQNRSLQRDAWRPESDDRF